MLYDIDIALQKVNRKIDNYIIITTEKIDEQVKAYASSIYAKAAGIEFAILDCIGFIRHFFALISSHTYRLPGCISASSA